MTKGHMDVNNIKIELIWMQNLNFVVDNKQNIDFGCL